MQEKTKKKLLFFITQDSYFVSHRLRLAEHALQHGFEVAFTGTISIHQSLLEKKNIQLFPLQYVNRSSLNPFKDIQLLKELFHVIKKYRPDTLHGVAMKPVLYSTLLGRLLKINKIVNVFGGMGYLFTEDQDSLTKKWVRQTIIFVFKLLFYSQRVTLITQNQDDKKLIQQLNLIDHTRLHLIKGVGIDTDIYVPNPPLFHRQIVSIAFVSRMLKHKGILELIDAVKFLLTKNLSFEMHFYGDIDKQNPSSMTEDQLKMWQTAKLIHWHGAHNNIAEIYQNSDIAVLPSYREGLPKSLLEAASCGLPIVTTDVPGCREVVEQNKNGFLVPVKNSKTLAKALEILINNPELRKTMGANSRKKAVSEFRVDAICEQVLKLF